MRVAIIDLGTNTFNLLIADIVEGGFKVVHASREVVKLGEKSINENRIGEAAYLRGLAAFARHAAMIKEKKVDAVKAFATSAIREAENGKAFVEDIRIASGIVVEVIDGDREAELIYKGNRMAMELGETSLIMDIGGGSTEFIISNKETIYWKRSFKLGVARLLERFKPEDPITEKTFAAVKDFIKNELSPLQEALKKHPTQQLVGSSGGFESVIDMIAASSGKTKETAGQSSYRVDLVDYAQMSKRTVFSTLAEREQMPGLIAMRRDMIVLTYLLIDVVVEIAQINRFVVSTYALKEGALYELIEKKC